MRMIVEKKGMDTFIRFSCRGTYNLGRQGNVDLASVLGACKCNADVLLVISMGWVLRFFVLILTLVILC